MPIQTDTLGQPRSPIREVGTLAISNAVIGAANGQLSRSVFIYIDDGIVYAATQVAGNTILESICHLLEWVGIPINLCQIRASYSSSHLGWY